MSVGSHRKLRCAFKSRSTGVSPLGLLYFFLTFVLFFGFHRKNAMGKDIMGKSSNTSTDLYSSLHQFKVPTWGSFNTAPLIYMFSKLLPSLFTLEAPKVVFDTSPDLTPLPQIGTSVLQIPTHRKSLSFVASFSSCTCMCYLFVLGH